MNLAQNVWIKTKIVTVYPAIYCHKLDVVISRCVLLAKLFSALLTALASNTRFCLLKGKQMNKYFRMRLCLKLSLLEVNRRL